MSQPTIVLVHGAFADASSFARVIPELLADGLKVVAPAVPNRSLVGDAEYLGSVLAAIDGPVVLVGHSYGCAVVTVAGVAENVRALVYLAGFVVDEDEALGELQGRFPDSDLAQALDATPFPGGIDLSVDPEKFPAVFAHDVDPALAAVLAVSQRPLSAAAFGDKAPAAAWRTRPAWGVVAASDHTINPEVQRFGYQRAGADVVEVDSSHLVMLSQPAIVADLIKGVVKSVSG
ncbi:alpha/beta hydrolase [Frankia sp. CNm7]|uniref:Alpha/beta hydrolase n=1 Tax=Frankia nepalensis TaxID=1836974 RepID=A0A937UVJ8_9ACTN|nr:alpha/beta hydrolase [Frankia nepalensis]MBL7500483.1 alpha/beta hydrolase [Frankia nepalensis]MBL7511237.1 alpha/beta hydrolase [Frankia nepalensis]MBL7523216.1 alpha/beta hydrolase [Frankia nepalensis]MBL7632341.1 alpha/beta hydrolase [Frankia nepalensis]